MSPRARKVRVAGADAAAFLAAAHALTELACVVVDKSGRAWSAALLPRPGAPKADLAARFEALYRTERLKGALRRAGAPLRAERLRRLLALGEGEGPGAPPPALAPERAAEIEALLAEDAERPGDGGDPLGVRTPWEDLRK